MDIISPDPDVLARDKSLAAGHGLISAPGCRLWVPEEELENHDRLVIIHREQFYYLNPDGFPKKGSIFKLEPHKIDLWILQTFTHTFDLASLESLGSAWSHAQQDNLPLMEIYHEYFDAPWLEIEPIHLHANITEISHLGKFLYKEHNVPEPFCRHSRDKKSFTDDLDSVRHWLQQIMRQSNLDDNHTTITESLIRHRWLLKYQIFLFPAFLFFHVMGPLDLFEAFYIILSIDDSFFFCVRVLYVEVILLYFCSFYFFIP
ncbi:hypothetical protein RhiirA4_234841 [Rhizophagus irregularis]|jgi:hypothetical protein|uniref:Uncharacterized protein n=1 Tax=Rhizophagus irregularis TaxID=588596 RepID=A0A2I1GQB7_9GLOM|nr:hypothetical protein RhiirA4_234841 [Rhizophagus irregularis]